MRPRSYLYVPADDDRKLASAPQRGADALIVDLEDAVAPAAKEAARAGLREWLGAPEDVPDGPEVWVRINAGADHREEDLAVAVHPRVRGVVVPKAEPALLAAVAARLDGLEAERPAALVVAPLVETAAGLADIAAVARGPRVGHLGLGEADLVAELGIEPSDDDVELLPVRHAVVLASAAVGLPPPVGPTSTAIGDATSLRASSLRLRRLGFRGRTAIHPGQLDVIHDVFTPSEEEVAAARDVIDRYEAAIAAGRGVSVDADGRLIDEAVVRSARRTLAFARPD